MTLFIERIEIRQQPEHKRYWAEVEVRVEAGFRRKFITTPYADGREGILTALSDYFDSLDPPLGYADGDAVVLDVLRTEAEAAGVRVDRRWGEARLRQEIAAVARPEGVRG